MVLLLQRDAACPKSMLESHIRVVERRGLQQRSVRQRGKWCYQWELCTLVSWHKVKKAVAATGLRRLTAHCQRLAALLLRNIKRRNQAKNYPLP